MASVSYYQELHIAPEASQEEIAAAYRRLARQYHPDRNPSPDAHHKMQSINEAYNTLRNPERRRRYDESLAVQAESTARGADTRTPPPSPPGASRARPSIAWLSYQKRIGAEIVFAIGHADDMTGLLADLQRRIPPSGRRYDITRNRWHVAAEYEDVLRTFFRNYAPVVQPVAAPAPPPRRGPVETRIPRGGKAPSRNHAGESKPWLGLALAVAAAFAVYTLIFGRVLLSDAAPADAVQVAPPVATAPSQVAAAEAENDTFVFPDDCTPGRLAKAPLYFQEACETLVAAPDAAAQAPAPPFALATTRVASNIRSGPDTRFPVLTTAAPGTRIQLVGYTVNRNYVWYLTNFGGWVRSDLLTELPAYLPLIGPDETS